MSPLDLNPRQACRSAGRLASVAGNVTAIVDAAMGDLVMIYPRSGSVVTAEVIGFDKDYVQLMPLGEDQSFRRGDLVKATGHRMLVPVGDELLGRVIDATGRPIDSKSNLDHVQKTSLRIQSPDPLQRQPISEPFVTGIRAIDGMLTIGKGQRVGLFAGSGVGKSTLLGEIANDAQSDVNVVALIGERGREVRPFIEESLGPAGLQRSIVIVSTSDEPPLARIRASELAVVIANWFRSRGKNVLLMLDSLTRLAHAQRELGLLLGEPPASRGYTPRTFQKMAELLEQLGNDSTGSITGLLTVLVDGDDMNDPVADAARSILDGHIVLSRSLAHRGHFPAIDVLASASRLLNELTSDEHRHGIQSCRSALAKYRDVEDLIQIGAYKKGAVPASDRAVEVVPYINQFLTQDLKTPSEYSETLNSIRILSQAIERQA